MRFLANLIILEYWIVCNCICSGFIITKDNVQLLYFWFIVHAKEKQLVQ